VLREDVTAFGEARAVAGEIAGMTLPTRRSLLDKLSTARWDVIIRGVWEYDVLRHFRTLPPRQLQINVTFRCNSRCTMCNIWQMEDRPEMDLAQFAQVLKDPLFDGIERLTLAGGEPSLRADLIPLTELFINRMAQLKSLTLVTNGLAVERILADSRDMLRLCSEHGINLNISVSLDGLGKIHDDMRNVPGAFSRVEECLLSLKELQSDARLRTERGTEHQGSFWFGVGSVITRKNLYHMRELQAWCDERGIEVGFQLVGFHETYVANLEQRAELDFDQADREYLLQLLEELAADRSASNFMAYYWNDMLRMYRDGQSRQTPCPFAVDSFVLDAYGDIYYCLSERKVGNCLSTEQGSTAEYQSAGPCSAIYYDPENLAFRRQMTRSSCLQCNSACFVSVGIKKDLKKYLWFLLSRTSRQPRHSAESAQRSPAKNAGCSSDSGAPGAQSRQERGMQ
jgi:MoaA/NifB/PqqE/SkfB family radical SAM enzyme